jgi:hypothetical protein
MFEPSMLITSAGIAVLIASGLVAASYAWISNLLLNVVIERSRRRGSLARARGLRVAALPTLCASGWAGKWPVLLAALVYLSSVVRSAQMKRVVASGGSWLMHILPTQKIRLFSVQHNGQFLFVSNDFENGDRVVECTLSPTRSATSSEHLRTPTTASVSSTLQPARSCSCPTTWQIQLRQIQIGSSRRTLILTKSATGLRSNVRTMEASSSSTPTPKDSCFYPTTNEATTS